MDVWASLIKTYHIKAVFTNADYEPYALKRDQEVKEFLLGKGIQMHFFKDQVIFEKNEVLKGDGKPYTVFTPFKNKWLSLFQESVIKSYDSACNPTAVLCCNQDPALLIEPMRSKWCTSLELSASTLSFALRSTK